MGDVGEYWNDHKEYKRKKKLEHASKAPDLIKMVKEKGYKVVKLSCHHYRVNNLIDWWPTTGTFRYKDGRKMFGGSDSGYGVKWLLKELK